MAVCAMPGVLRLEHYDPDWTDRSAERIRAPKIVGYMSVNSQRQCSSDLSQLKFLNSIPTGKISLDLNLDLHTTVKRTSEDNNEKMSILLKFLMLKNQSLPFLDTKRDNVEDFPFICYRSTLVTVMSSVGEDAAPWRVMATVYQRSIYINSLETTVEKNKKASTIESKCSAWAYKFKQYMLSDRPQASPNLDKPINENEEFSLFYYTNMDTHVLLYGAQTDGVLSVERTLGYPPEIEHPDTNLAFLKKHGYVELQTYKEFQTRAEEQCFKKLNLLKTWCKCYLADTKGLLVGFRNDKGCVRRLQWLDTEKMEQYCQNEWESKRVLAFLNTFLSLVKIEFKDHLIKKYGNNYISKCDVPISLHFELVADKNIKVTDNYDREYDMILPSWFTV